MKSAVVTKPLALLPGSPIAALVEDYSLHLTMVYQDRNTQAWAAETYNQVANLIGKENIHFSSWPISDLLRPGVVSDAVWSAAQADVIIVAVSAREKMPDDLCTWVHAWLPRRARQPGTLMALIALPEGPADQAFLAKKYLRDIARKGRLYFLLREQKHQPHPVL
jgi:hypothetical protein